MGLKKSIMLSDEAVAYINSRHKSVEGEPRWSAAINGAVDTLRSLYQSNFPTLPEKAWVLLLNAHSGHFFDWRPTIPMRLASDIMDDLGVLSLEELEADEAGMVKLIHGLTQLEQLAVFEVIRIFWAAGPRHGDMMDMIEECRKCL